MGHLRPRLAASGQGPAVRIAMRVVERSSRGTHAATHLSLPPESRMSDSGHTRSLSACSPILALLLDERHS